MAMKENIKPATGRLGVLVVGLLSYRIRVGTLYQPVLSHGTYRSQSV